MNKRSRHLKPDNGHIVQIALIVALVTPMPPTHGGPDLVSDGGSG